MSIFASRKGAGSPAAVRLPTILLGTFVVISLLASIFVLWQIYTALTQPNVQGRSHAQVFIVADNDANGLPVHIDRSFLRQQVELARSRAVIDRAIDAPDLSALLIQSVSTKSKLVPSMPSRDLLRSYVLDHLKIDFLLQPPALSFTVKALEPEVSAALSNALALSYKDVLALGGPAKFESMRPAQFQAKRFNLISLVSVLAIALGVGLMLILALSDRIKSLRKTKLSRNTSRAQREKPHVGAPRITRNSNHKDTRKPTRIEKPNPSMSSTKIETIIANRITATSQNELVLFVEPSTSESATNGNATQLIDTIVDTAKELKSRGVKAVIVDAGWHPDDHNSDMLGISDVNEGYANFGEVLHCDEASGLSFVPRGAGVITAHIQPDIVELRDAMIALSDVVLVHIGNTQTTSLFETFARDNAMILMVEPDTGRNSWTRDERQIEQDRWNDMGFKNVHLIERNKQTSWRRTSWRQPERKSPQTPHRRATNG